MIEKSGKIIVYLSQLTFNNQWRAQEGGRGSDPPHEQLTNIYVLTYYNNNYCISQF